MDIQTKGQWTIVCDGEFLYSVAEEYGEKTAAKYKPDPAQFGEPKAVLENLEKHFNIKLLPEQKVDGLDCVVFELTPKNPETSPTARTISYFRKDVGLNIKNSSYDKEGKEAFVSVTSGIEINVSVDVDKFKFTPPAGVTVEDKTKG